MVRPFVLLRGNFYRYRVVKEHLPWQAPERPVSQTFALPLRGAGSTDQERTHSQVPLLEVSRRPFLPSDPQFTVVNLFVNRTSIFLRDFSAILWRRSGSNRQPPACKAGALPVELRPRPKQVGALGFEPRTSALSGLRSSQLSYAPGAAPSTRKPNLRWFGPIRLSA
jgi:hypothetical protein